MLTTLIVKCINFCTNIITSYLPHFTLDTKVLDNANAAVSTLTDFLVQVNFIIPLPDIALIIGIDLGIRIFKLSLFVGNLIIDKILSVIP